MSNYDLYAEINRLQAELRRVEAENNQLRGEISYGVNNVNAASSNIVNYKNKVRNGVNAANNSIHHSIDTALEAYRLQGEVDRLYSRFKAVELANKRIRACNNKIYYDFKNHRTVRKIMQGLMDNMDLNLVSDRIIYRSVEQEHLMTPDFWLTSALISIMAWKGDDRELAERAMEYSLSLNKKDSCVFYMLFYLFLDHKETSLKWFKEYQKCDLKGSDADTFLMLFALLSDATDQQLDDEMGRLVYDYILQTVRQSTRTEGYREDVLIDGLKKKMVSMMTPMEYDFPLLAQYCKDYKQIEHMLNLAQNNNRILEYTLDILNVSQEEKNHYVKEYLNELLSHPCEVEMETYDEIEYNEEIIRLRGDIEAAKASYAENKERKAAELNLIMDMIKWVFQPDPSSTDSVMRKNMAHLIKDFEAKAMNEYIRDYRAIYRGTHPVEIMDYRAEMDFQDGPREQARIEAFYDGKEAEELSRISNVMAYVMFVLGAACAGAGIYLAIWPLLAGLGVGLALGGAVFLANNNSKKNIHMKYSTQKEKVIAILRDLFGEYKKMQQQLMEYDGVSKQVFDAIGRL